MIHGECKTIRIVSWKSNIHARFPEQQHLWSITSPYLKISGTIHCAMICWHQCQLTKAFVIFRLGCLITSLASLILEADSLVHATFSLSLLVIEWAAIEVVSEVYLWVVWEQQCDSLIKNKFIMGKSDQN